MGLRKIGLGLALASGASGCSGPHGMVAQNRMSWAMEITVEWTDPDGFQGCPTSRSEHWALGPGESGQRTVWYGSDPGILKVTAQGEGRTLSHRFFPWEHPALMREGPSLGSTFHLIVQDDRFELTGPTAWDGFEQDMPLYVLGFVLFGVPLLVHKWPSLRHAFRRRTR